MEKLERDLNAANDKSEKAQRELITLEREKRKAEDEKAKLDASVGKLEGDMRMITRYLIDLSIFLSPLWRLGSFIHPKPIHRGLRQF